MELLETEIWYIRVQPGECSRGSAMSGIYQTPFNAAVYKKGQSLRPGPLCCQFQVSRSCTCINVYLYETENGSDDSDRLDSSLLNSVQKSLKPI